MTGTNAWYLIVAFLFANAGLSTGCSSSFKYEHKIQNVIPTQIRARRPAGPGADASVGPGGTDYRGDPLPNERLDCETIGELFKAVPLAKVRECFMDLMDPVQVSYRLSRTAQPSLRLRNPEEAPACLVETLSEIPVPREILFQARQKDRLSCFSSRLDIEADELLGSKVPKNQLAIEIVFPLEDLPKDENETLRTLASWALTPLWKDSGGALKAKIVPDALCEECFGKDSLLHDSKRGKLPKSPESSWPR